MPHYIYGIVESGAKPPRRRGVANAPVRVIAGEHAAALVSDLPTGEVRLGREEMLAHSRVLEAAISKGTVLPMRLGVVMSDAEEIRRRLLEDHAADLSAQLGEFDGKVEIRIRAVYEEKALFREIVSEDPEIDALRRSMASRSEDATYYERIQLGERVAGRIEHKRERDGAAIVDALAPAALAIDESKASHERVALNASFLVERARLKQFDKILDEIAAQNAERMRFKYTGPLPPHSFVQLAGST